MDASYLWSFLLIFVRITSFMVSAPIFSGRQLPAQYKIGLSTILSLLCVGLVDEPNLSSLPLWELALLILKEIFVGITIGLSTGILFYSVQMAGSLLDIQIGFFMANLFDPTFETNTQLTGRLKNMLAILVMLSIDGHHLLIQGILASFDWISLTAIIPSWMDGKVSTFILDCFKQMFMIGFMMALPIIGTLFIVDVALGIISRTVPQMNIIAIAPPIKILIHFLIYILVLPSFFYLLKILFENMIDSIGSILKIMGA
ncbi:flagellar biosynthetic protein FliR [Neobacillus thermocopriae]|uniref:Flagellar biosynthetic protein FliR n=1 Tax=Neobacillus thermocopriae TaxID=1215031 RepID=A0A6B3TQM0_9BACI|nr:flagellar biosynthetic protein FliR [Neobacillus thermocopriae]MED3623985.1 flagellar biosynthetic protein FliR [Neobacillus thermocopriae]MED3713820.1 flagellar biosynthetic protein FliR [Neobacillus thermocopriae]NEX78037.1 flagellar type III secretion system protein FliR [Neobacillus thermocopriae]